MNVNQLHGVAHATGPRTSLLTIHAALHCLLDARRNCKEILHFCCESAAFFRLLRGGSHFLVLDLCIGVVARAFTERGGSAGGEGGVGLCGMHCGGGLCSGGSWMEKIQFDESEKDLNCVWDSDEIEWNDVETNLSRNAENVHNL